MTEGKQIEEIYDNINEVKTEEEISALYQKIEKLPVSSKARHKLNKQLELRHMLLRGEEK